MNQNPTPRYPDRFNPEIPCRVIVKDGRKYLKRIDAVFPRLSAAYAAGAEALNETKAETVKVIVFQPGYVRRRVFRQDD